MTTIADKKLIQEALENFKLPSYDEIPDVGLYLVQVTNYINGYLADFPGMEVTTSMISNYVKLKLVSKPIKKVYSREQIAYFTFIAMTKTAISLEDIQTMFGIQQQLCTPGEGYEFFRAEMLDALKTFYTDSGKAASDKSQSAGDADSSEERKLLSNVASVVAHKMYLNRYFSVMKSEINK